MFFLFADEVKTNNLELYFCKVFWYKWFCKKPYFRYCNLFIRKDLLERYWLERIKSFVRHVQFMVAQKHNLVRHLILPRVFPSGRMSGVFFVWSDKFWFRSDIVRCPTVILRPAMCVWFHSMECSRVIHRLTDNQKYLHLLNHSVGSFAWKCMLNYLLENLWYK